VEHILTLTLTPPQDPAAGLRSVSFTADGGCTTAVVGATGSGKTTLGRLLFRFYDPLAGAVLIAGLDVAKVTQASVRRAIGVVPQVRRSGLLGSCLWYRPRFCASAGVSGLG
jgi:ABC-type transport system involved in Fe-S cluster assembly fused permease/ATPase subunit